MAYVRLHQSGFESSTTIEWGSENSASTGNSVLNSNPDYILTGNYALANAESRTYHGNFKNINQISINYFLYFELMRSGTTLGRIIARKDGNDYSISARYVENTKEFLFLDSNSVQLGSAQPAFLSSFSPFSWMAIGITAKCGVDGWISLYIDGERVLTYEGDLFDDNSINTFAQGGTLGLVISSGYVTDDVTINQCTEDEPDVAPHSPRYYPLRPNSRGLNTEWVPVGHDDNYRAVATYNDNTDNVPYIFAEYNDLVDTYRFPSPHEGNVVAVIANAIAHGGGSLFGTEIELITTDGTTEITGAVQEVGYGLDIVWERFPIPPSGGSWNAGILGETNFGFRSIIAIHVNLVATEISETQIDLTWNDIVGDEDGYSIQRSTNGMHSWSEIDTVPADSTSYSDTGLDPNTQYFYRIRAYKYA